MGLERFSMEPESKSWPNPFTLKTPEPLQGPFPPQWWNQLGAATYLRATRSVGQYLETLMFRSMRRLRRSSSRATWVASYASERHLRSMSRDLSMMLTRYNFQKDSLVSVKQICPELSLPMSQSGLLAQDLCVLLTLLKRSMRQSGRNLRACITRRSQIPCVFSTEDLFLQNL